MILKAVFCCQLPAARFRGVTLLPPNKLTSRTMQASRLPNQSGINGLPSANGVATLHTRGSTFDTVLAVYQGSSLGSLVAVAADDDSGGNLTSEVRFNATAN